jgi:hypothetical protein
MDRENRIKIALIIIILALFVGGIIGALYLLNPPPKEIVANIEVIRYASNH